LTPRSSALLPVRITTARRPDHIRLSALVRSRSTHFIVHANSQLCHGPPKRGHFPAILAGFQVHMYTHTRVYINIYAYIYTDMHIYIYIHIYMHLYAHTCTYICIRVHIHTYAQIENPQTSNNASTCQAIS